MEVDNEFSVIVSNVYKRYSPKCPVLNGICMNIPKGSMYGLIGPSGCGKTTLLQSILGKTKIDSGTIKLDVKYWKEVGFMPQNVSLHSELKVNEIFVFYGALFGIFGIELYDRINMLTELLELPPFTESIQSCSGGQQRRISLAITLLHNPKLYILDEPTVGLDTVLSSKIWIHLRNLSLNHGKTIIVTTHYMEEAKSLHRIGLMRGGVLLAEKSPQALMNEFNCAELDAVFLQLSKKQETRRENEINDDNSTKAPKNQKLLKNKKEFDRNHLWAQLYKNFKWLGNIKMTLFILLLPVFITHEASIVLSEVHSVTKIGYYSEETLNTTCQENVTFSAEDCPPTSPYSCAYLDLLQKKYQLERYDSIEDGRNAVKKGDIFLFIHLPYNFSENILKRLSFKLTEDDAFDLSMIDIWMDTTDFVASFYGKIDVYSSLEKTLELKLRECGLSPKLSKYPLSFQKPVYGTMKYNMRAQVYPSLLNMYLYYSTFLFTSALLLMEKESGVLERVQINGMTMLELLTANFIVQLIVVNVQNILVFITVYVIYQEKYQGNIFLMYFIVHLTEILGSAVGLLVLSFTKSSLLIGYGGTGMVLFIFFTSGMAWPSEAVYWILEPFSRLIPVNMAASSYYNVMLRGFTLKSNLVYPGVLYTIGWFIAILAIVAIKIKRNNNQL